MIIYVVIMVFVLPTCILTPVFIKLSHMNSQFGLRKDISADFLDQDYEDDEINGDPDDPDENSDEQISKISSEISQLNR